MGCTHGALYNVHAPLRALKNAFQRSTEYDNYGKNNFRSVAAKACE